MSSLSTIRIFSYPVVIMIYFRVAVSEHSVFCLISFVASTLYRVPCTASSDFRSVEDLCRDGILPPSCEGVLIFVQDNGLFEIVFECTFGIPQSYLKFHHTLRVEKSSDGNSWWFLYSASESIVSDIPAGQIPGRKCFLDDEVISNHIDTVKVSFLVDQSCFSADARDASMAVSGSPGKPWGTKTRWY